MVLIDSMPFIRKFTVIVKCRGKLIQNPKQVNKTLRSAVSEWRAVKKRIKAII